MSHPIPDDALDSDIAILGKKGGGKTFTAKGIVERLLDLGRRVLILDPLGVWAGLRTSADGDHPGYPVAIFGGLHADMALDPAAAEPLARIIATENLPAVVDLSELSKHAQQSFLLAFLHELRRVNSEALTVVLEEADVFAPQNPLGDDSKALHGEIDWIARRGRFKGFRLITITQRPARLSKDVLTQCSTLIAHRLPSPQDRDAVKAWVDGNGDRDRAREVFDSLATLAVGEAWVYAPEHDILARARFPAIKTLDTSATPKAGEKRIEPKSLAEVDLSAVRQAMTDATPAKATKKASATADEIAAADERGYQRGLAEGIERGKTVGASIMLSTVQSTIGALRVPDLIEAYSEESSRVYRADLEQPAERAKNAALRTKVDVLMAWSKAGDPLLRAAMQVWPARMTWAGLAAMCGRKARGGHFNTARKALIDGGLVRMDGELVTPTNPPETPEGVIPADLLEQNLPQPAAKMFATIRARPEITAVGLASVLQMQPRGGHWNTGMSTLRRNGLIDESDDRLTIKPELL